MASPPKGQGVASLTCRKNSTPHLHHNIQRGTVAGGATDRQLRTETVCDKNSHGLVATVKERVTESKSPYSQYHRVISWAVGCPFSHAKSLLVRHIPLGATGGGGGPGYNPGRHLDLSGHLVEHLVEHDNAGVYTRVRGKAGGYVAPRRHVEVVEKEFRHLQALVGIEANDLHLSGVGLVDEMEL